MESCISYLSFDIQHLYICYVVAEKIKFDTHHVIFFSISVFSPKCAGNMGIISGRTSGIKRVKIALQNTVK